MRADGKRLRNTDPMYTVAAYVMSKRVDSMNMVTLDIPYDPIQEYLNKKRREGVSLSHLGVIIAAYLRTAAEFPLLNRFIMNCKPYARNEFCVAMVVLKSGQMDNGTMSKMYFNMTDTIFDVNDTINKYVSDNREVPEKNGTEKMIKILLGAPGVLRVGVGLFKFMDKHGGCFLKRLLICRPSTTAYAFRIWLRSAQIIFITTAMNSVLPACL